MQYWRRMVHELDHLLVTVDVHQHALPSDSASMSVRMLSHAFTICSRAQRRKALQRGASPLLLPEPRRSRTTSESSAGSLEEGDLPNVEVLQRSEFLEPLDEGTQRLYEYLLSGLQSRTSGG